MCFVVKDSEALGHWIYKRERIEEADFPAYCSYGPISWENPSKWQGVILGPPGSPYEDGVFFLSIDLPDEYPSKPPTIKFKTKVCFSKMVDFHFLSFLQFGSK